MVCSCIRDYDQRFEFDLQSFDCKSFTFIDLSSWEEPVKDEVHPMTITTPDGRKVEVEFNIKGYTTYRLTENECIDDGIYCFEVDSCGNKFKRSKAIVCTLECKLHYLKQRENSDYGQISRLESMIASIKSSASTGNIQTAGKLYEEVSKIFDKLHCTCSCK